MNKTSQESKPVTLVPLSESHALAMFYLQQQKGLDELPLEDFIMKYIATEKAIAEQLYPPVRRNASFSNT